jgi:hypothetical protein
MFFVLATNTNTNTTTDHLHTDHNHQHPKCPRFHAMPPKGKKGQNEKAKAGEEERDEPLQAVV